MIHAYSFGSVIRADVAIVARRKIFISTTSFPNAGAAQALLKMSRCFARPAIYERERNFILPVAERLECGEAAFEVKRDSYG